MSEGVEHAVGIALTRRHELMGLPDSVEIQTARYDFDAEALYVKITGPSLPERKEGEMVRYRLLQYPEGYVPAKAEIV